MFNFSRVFRKKWQKVSNGKSARQITLLVVGRLLRVVRGIIYSTLARIKLYCWGASVGKSLMVNGSIKIYSDGRLKIGEKVRMNSGYSNYVGGEKKIAIWVGRTGDLAIGDGCAISNTNIVCLSAIEIGANTYVGGGCNIYDTDFHPLDPVSRISGNTQPPCGPIKIGENIFIGAYSTILKNVTIGDGAVIGAGSIVTKNVPEYEIWAGVPASKIGNVKD